MTRPRILFVCTVNRMRSATAHKIYQDDLRFEVDSAGTDRTAAVVLEEWHLEWADAIVVMEKYHSNAIRTKFPELYDRKPIVCLYIEDIYDKKPPRNCFWKRAGGIARSSKARDLRIAEAMQGSSNAA
jgi:predicted protein tyrosine phosphatase